MNRTTLASAALPAALLAAALGLSACSAAPAAPDAAGSSNELGTITPGVLTIGTALPSPPMGHFDEDGTTAIGVDVDLMAEVAERLGLTLDMQNASWDGLIPGAKSHRYDAVWASIGDFTERQRQIDFVDYLSVYSAVIMPRSAADGIAGPEGLCGLTVGGTKGAVAITVAQEFSADCEAAGSPAITISEFPDNATGLLSLRSGRTDAHIMDGPSAVYEAGTSGSGTEYAVALDRVGPQAIYGVGVNKTSVPLRDAIATALNETIADGTYADILARYDVSSYAIDEATVNGGGAQNP